jgi:hypothetical protein
MIHKQKMTLYESMRTGVLLALLGFLAAGCSSLPPITPVIVKGLIPGDPANTPAHVAEVAAGNQIALQYYEKVERPLRVHPDRPPQLGIALSGGGMRAAVFSLGVLTGLHDIEVFPQRTDFLSAVSGGGYIASWFYAQQVLNDCTPAQLLDSEGAAQNYLRTHGDFVEIKPRHPGSYVAIFNTLLPLGIANLFANGLFGLHANTPATSPYYISRFQDTFFRGTKPCEFGDAGPNDRSVAWAQIQDKIEASNLNHGPSGHIPNFILDSTAAFGYTKNDESTHGFNTVYEVTPQRFGSEGMGYYCYPESDPQPPECKRWPSELGTLERLAMTSGAALDTSAIHGRLWRLALSAFNFDLGHFFPNPGAASYPPWQLALPFPFYMFTEQYHLGAGGRRMLLSDGGHSENLGVYALVRRVPGTIVVVDGTSDSEHSFDDYQILRNMLCTDLQMKLSIPAVDDAIIGPKKAQCDDRVRKLIPPADRATDGGGAIYYGTIRDIPESAAQVSSIQMVYIKLPLRKFVESECLKKPRSVPDTVCCYLDGNTRFPFDGTFTDQSYDPRQFAAYRDLGQWVVTRSRDELRAKLPKD